ncbi:putative transcription factor & lipid binding HD-SAD family [Helianthus annuus]|uniref:Putative homeobox-leucine zipper protein ROC7 n=1 Tax=Helianthus annuus TaxID=4232 RepID=A0A251T714_HELAN|nr:putative transcription factor & lipid binding HD-SAD family [Helianthus annuus]KAJ0515196.1 putative transcription factor & lipid binding HD-SAD family [Helianthus annuus]KAJ0531385.1 putative transcription factor & lipid binding HD-SAD family [Helianthus annuus]KAJ0698228.1 putative transcription factor & lipid binding HD-SAD family [Helianthus annuus]KAJ0881301.1 putative transcription factor & lipid binding HD-SAD family [Helianthus annuus]
MHTSFSLFCFVSFCGNSFFKKNPHPTEKERTEIANKLNITINKVKFWFQNRRTQLKSQKERSENVILKQENEQLRLDNLAMAEVLKNPLCNKCGAQATIPDGSIHKHKVVIENTRLKEELSHMANFASHVSQMFGIPLPNKVTIPGDPLNPIMSRSLMDYDIPIQRNEYLVQASRAMEVLLKLGNVNAPLWNRNIEGGGETLNFVEYERAFPPSLGTKPPGFISEATRARSVVPMTSSTLVEALLNADQWREMFIGIIGSCTTMEVISNGTGGSRNGALQLMKAEIQLISPLVPVRGLKFIRFAKQQAQGQWTVVDLSIDSRIEGHMTRRCPSGCILHDMPNGFTMVTWIEHTEYDEQSVSHQYRQLINSGVGFGAQRWISALLRHCESITAIMSPTLNHHLLQDTKRSLRGLAQRMMSIFCGGVCLTDGQQWDLVADHAPKRPRIMAHNYISGFGEPMGIVTSATYSVWIPTNHQHLFDMLKTKDRCIWDVICHRIAARNMIHLPLGQDETSPNCISILYSNMERTTEDDQVMVLQETISDMTGSLIVYATIDFPTVSVVMNGEDISSVALLPSGLCIVPGYGEDGAGGERGSMVTVGLQLLHPDITTSNMITMETIIMINDLVARTVQGIIEIV